jgi:hypothetical protein
MSGVDRTLLPRRRAESEGKFVVEGESEKGKKEKERLGYN